jgi:hypothetical protein
VKPSPRSHRRSLARCGERRWRRGIVWPAAFFVQGDKQNAAELARLKALGHRSIASTVRYTSVQGVLEGLSLQPHEL